MRNNTTAVADRLGILPEYRSAFLNMSMDEASHTYTVPGVGEGMESVTTKIQRVYNKDFKAGNISTTVKAYRTHVEKYRKTWSKDNNQYFMVPVEDIDGIDEVATEAVQTNLEWYGNRGTAIHTAIETHDTKGEYGSYVQAVDAWFNSHDHVGELLAHEVMIYHPTGKYAGTIDGVGVGPDGGLIIWDYKSGQKAPDDINPMTRASVAGLAGSGLIGVAKDNLEAGGTPPALATGFIQIELDIETGTFDIIDYLGVADCGTVLHPEGLAQQIKGGAVMGFGMAALERHVYDPQNGLPASTGLYQCKPPSILDVPPMMQTDAVDKADPMNPIGARGIGEPTMGCAAAALLCAISDALGGHYFNRIPVLPDMIVNAVSGQPQSYKPLQVNTF